MNSSLKKIVSLLPTELLQFLGCASIIIGLYCSRAMMSIGMITLLASALINNELPINFKFFLKQKHLLFISGYFLLLSISVFWSTDIPYYLIRIQTILPFLILPFAIYSFKHWKKEWFNYLILLFIVLNVLGCSYSLINYFSNKAMYDESYIHAKVIPTPFQGDHIRFSLAVVVSIMFCVDLINEFKQQAIKILLFIIGLFGIIYLHILAAKTGLLAFYFIAFIFIAKLILSQKHRKKGVITLIGIMVLPFLMYQVSTSFRNKIAYVLFSYKHMQNEKKEVNVSDEGRMISYQYAIEIIKAHPVIGVGYGDIYNETEQKFKRDFKDESVKILLPHNQFLVVGIAMGIIGILYLVFMQLVLFKKSFQTNFLLFCFWAIFFFAMMVEPLYETQYGTCLFLFLFLFLLKRSENAKKIRLY